MHNLGSHMSSPREEYIDWKYYNEAVGCLFARHLAKRPEVDGFRVETIEASASVQRVAKKIETVVADAIGVPEVHSLTIVLPKLGNFRRWIEISELLSEVAGWKLEDVVFTQEEKDKVPFDPEAFHYKQLTRLLTRADGAIIPSEALFLGPFEFFPPTRRAPHCALELYVGTPRPTDAITNEPTERANLAHIDARSLTKTTFEKMAANTKLLRRKSLGISEEQDDLRAKAKVSFAFPVVGPEAEGSVND